MKVRCLKGPFKIITLFTSKILRNLLLLKPESHHGESDGDGKGDGCDCGGKGDGMGSDYGHGGSQTKPVTMCDLFPLACLQ